MTSDVDFLNESNDSSDSDSGIQHEPIVEPDIFQVYQAGEVTVVGFRGNNIPAGFWIGGYKDALSNIVKEYACQELAFDFTGVTNVPSGMLGLFASLGDLDVTLSVYNPSDDVREILRATNLCELVEIRDVELEG